MRSLWQWGCMLGLAAAVASCDEKNPGPSDNDTAQATRVQLLQAAGTCVTSRAQSFATGAAELEASTNALRTAADVPAARESAKVSFRKAMLAFQELEAMRFGPLAPRSVAGGKDLRDPIYSWPLVSPCGVDELVVSKGYESGLPQALVNRRGLAAIEYLLYVDAATSSCAASSSTATAFNALSADERSTRRRAYAAAAAADVRAQGDALLSAWSANGENFANTLATAGSGNATYPSTQAALNAISDGLFALEKEGKDAKLAVPLGLRDCTSAPCPEALESRSSKLSKENLVANLRGFRALVEGCDASYAGTGFDDLLIAVGKEDVASKLLTLVKGIETSLQAIDEPDLETALNTDFASVRAAYDAFKAMNDMLKTEFVSVLDLELPAAVEGDND
ncbi:MAG: imelysin family protein [Myxococcaceae bacterium]